MIIFPEQSSYYFELINQRFRAEWEPITGHGWEFLKKHGLADEVLDIYRVLGGKNARPSINFRRSVLRFEEGQLYLCHQLHFNRYRALTLQSDFYADFEGFNVGNYRMYCRQFEGECQKSGLVGAQWRHNFADKQFGRASPPGDFSGNGSSAWKQRAFEDFLFDIYCHYHKQPPTVLLSVYDKMMVNREFVTVGEAAFLPGERPGQALLKSICRKLSVPFAPEGENPDKAGPQEAEHKEDEAP